MKVNASELKFGARKIGQATDVVNLGGLLYIIIVLQKK